MLIYLGSCGGDQPPGNFKGSIWGWTQVGETYHRFSIISQGRSNTWLPVDFLAAGQKSLLTCLNVGQR